MSLNVEEVRKQAQLELAKENFRDAVEKEKARLRNKRPLLHRLFPFKIIIVRR